jgi:alpha-galactosidase
MLRSKLEAGVRPRVAVVLLSSVLATLGARPVSAQTVTNPQLIEFIPPVSGQTATTSYLGDIAWTSATNDYGPVERNGSNGEDLAGDGATITLNGATYTKGLGVHAA